jgi:hypothetical protein
MVKADRASIRFGQGEEPGVIGAKAELRHTELFHVLRWKIEVRLFSNFRKGIETNCFVSVRMSVVYFLLK